MSDFEEFAHPPEGGPFKKWFLGYVVPVVIISYTINSLVIGEIFVPAKNAKTVSGISAQWVGSGYFSIAAFMHFHWGWGLSRRLLLWSHYGKVFSLLVLAASAFAFLYCSISAF